MQIKSFSIIAAVMFFSLAAPFTIAKDFKASIVTYPGVASAPLKLMLDQAALKTALGQCINPIIKVKVTAQNTQKTVARFDKVQLLFADGTVSDINKASKADALAATAFTYSYDFPLSSADIKKGVAGIALSFIDAGGDDSTGKVVVAGALLSVECQVGNACIAVSDAIVNVLPLPPPQVSQIQNKPVIVYVGGGGSATSAGPRAGGTFTSGNIDGFIWNNPSNAATLNSIYTTSDTILTGYSENLQARNFGFSIPLTATINGIEFKVTLKSNSGSGFDRSIKFVKAGTPVGTDFARGSSVFWPVSDTTVTFGGSTQLAGVSWTAADINNINFGINVSGDGGGDTPISIDYVSATIYYTTAGASAYDALRDFSQQMMEKFFCAVLRQKCE